MEIALRAKARSGKTVKKFKSFIEEDATVVGELKELGDRVIEFSSSFPFPGQIGDI